MIYFVFIDKINETQIKKEPIDEEYNEAIQIKEEPMDISVSDHMDIDGNQSCLSVVDKKDDDDSSGPSSESESESDEESDQGSEVTEILEKSSDARTVKKRKTPADETPSKPEPV